MKYARIVNHIVEGIAFDRPMLPDGSPEPDWTQVADDIFAGFSQATDGTFSPPPQAAPSRDQVNAEEFRRITAGLTFDGTLFDYDDIAKHRISGAATLAGFAIAKGAADGDFLWQGGVTPFEWIAKDNSVVPLDAPTMLAFGQAAGAWETAHVFACKDIKEMDPIPQDYQDDKYWPVGA